ncbi:MAG: alkaline phosphatase D family protein [Bacteroidia bacterium]|nr:alkaline phosphatase D family protein [Bacteroidia bacterium]
MSTKIIGHQVGAISSTNVSFWVGVFSSKSKDIRPTETIVEIWNMSRSKMLFEIEFIKKPLRGPNNKKRYNKGWFASCNSLRPSTVYTYNIRINGKDIDPYLADGKFKTYPERNVKQPLKILVTSCLKAKAKTTAEKGEDRSQKVWDHINKNHNDVDITLILGDTHYANDWRRHKKWEFTEAQFKIKDFQKHLSNTPVYAIYDDHDFIKVNSEECGAGNFALHNKKYGPNPLRVKASLNHHGLWNVPIPIRPDGNPWRTIHEGCFQKIEYGFVDIYLLDTRYYRESRDYADFFMRENLQRSVSLLGSNNKVVQKKKGNYRVNSEGVRIGNIQWNWIEWEFGNYKKLPDGDKRVKIICLGSTMCDGTDRLMPTSKNQNYKYELKKLGSILKGHKNVIFCSGDMHRLEYNLLPKQYFDVDPQAREIMSSGIGRTTNREKSQLVGGYAILELFQDQENEIKVKFYQPSGENERHNRKYKVPPNQIIKLKGY